MTPARGSEAGARSTAGIEFMALHEAPALGTVGVVVTAHRLRSSADIRRTVAARRAAGGAHVVVHALDRGDGEAARVAVVAGRKVGNAVVRNRAKRRLRSILRGVVLPTGTDLVVTAKAGADVAAYACLLRDLTHSVGRAVRRTSQVPPVAGR